MRMSFINSDLLYRGALYRQVCLYLIYIGFGTRNKNKNEITKIIEFETKNIRLLLYYMKSNFSLDIVSHLYYVFMPFS